MPRPVSTRRLKGLQSLSYLLDNSIRIPILNYRIGLDALLGLVPGIGDLTGLALSGIIVVQAARMGVSRAVLSRMLFNVGLEVVVGAVPLLGDAFDAVWKANARNMYLLETALKLDSSPGGKARTAVASRPSNRGVFLLVGAALLILGVTGTLLTLLIIWLAQQLF